MVENQTGKEAWLAELAARYGTPLYAYDADCLAARATELHQALEHPSGSRVYYSFKSNPLPSVAAELRQAGCQADLTSPGELLAAQEAGFDFSQALYGGPGKSVEELVLAMETGVRHFSVESRHDLVALSRAAGRQGGEARVLLRINPQEAPKAKLAMSGVASQFGFEESWLMESGRAMLDEADPLVRVVGVHIYWGTQIGDPEALLACFAKTVAIAEQVSEALGFPLEVLNLGGGFAWPYAHRGAGYALDPLRDGLAELRSGSTRARDAVWWFESGRYLTASSGSLVARVMEVKSSKEDKLYLILDTGIHHLGGMSGLGRIPRFSIDFEVPSHRLGGEEMVVDVVGQLCTPLDCIAKKTTLPWLEPGDLVSIPNTGAYGPTASVLAFLSRPTPIEVLYRGGTVLRVHRLRSGHEVVG